MLWFFFFISTWRVSAPCVAHILSFCISVFFISWFHFKFASFHSRCCPPPHDCVNPGHRCLKLYPISKTLTTSSQACFAAIVFPFFRCYHRKSIKHVISNSVDCKVDPNFWIAEHIFVHINMQFNSLEEKNAINWWYQIWLMLMLIQTFE